MIIQSWKVQEIPRDVFLKVGYQEFEHRHSFNSSYNRSDAGKEGGFPLPCFLRWVRWSRGHIFWDPHAIQSWRSTCQNLKPGRISSTWSMSGARCLAAKAAHAWQCCGAVSMNTKEGARPSGGIAEMLFIMQEESASKTFVSWRLPLYLEQVFDRLEASWRYHQKACSTERKKCFCKINFCLNL